LTGCPGGLPICSVDSVWPKPSRMVMPQASRTCSMTSGLRGSPAPTSSRTGTCTRVRSAWISIRHTVGGAQNVLTPFSTITSSSLSASNFV
jgi:hypothetical protein